MAEAGSDLSIQSQNVSIPGLAAARRAQEEDVQNQEIEGQRVEEARQAEVRQEDSVSVNENGPGAIEQQEIRAEGENLNVPSQDIQENLGQSLGDQFQTRPTLTDLNDSVETASDLSVSTQQLGNTGINQAVEQAREFVQEPVNSGGSGDQIEAAAEASAQSQVGGQGALEVLQPTAPQGVDAGAESEGLTDSDAGLAATSTGQANASNQNLRDAVEADAQRREEQENQDNNQRDPEQTNRGQNIDSIV